MPTELEFSQILKSVSDAILATDFARRLVYVNEHATRLLGLRREEMIGKTLEEVFPEIVDTRFFAAVQRVANGGLYEEFVEYYAAHGGWYNTRFYPAPAGGVTIFFTDSTQQQRTDHRLKLALESGRMGVWEYDFTTGKLTFDDRFLDLFDLPDSVEESGDSFLDMVHPDDRESVALAVEEATEKNVDFDHEFRVLRKDGTLHWIQSKAAIARNSANQPVSMVGVSFDITARKQAEQQLRDLNGSLENRAKERKAQLEMIAENVPGYFALIDRNFRYVFVNHRYEETFRAPVAEILNRPVVEVVGEETWRRIEHALRAAMAGEEQNFDIDMKVPGGMAHILKVCYMPQRDVRNRVTGVFVLAIDNSKEHHLQQEVLDAGEREKMRIGIEMHDELCQQMSGIGFEVKVLANKLRRKGLDALAGAAEQIVQHVNATTAATRDLARGIAPIKLEGSSLEDSLRVFLNELRERNSNLKLRLDVALKTRELSATLATQLYRITREAVANALKHGEATRVDVRFWATKRDVFLAILDDGNGDPEKLAKLKNKGLGLRSIEYRTRILGGILRFENGIGRPGVQILCRLPLAHLELNTKTL